MQPDTKFLKYNSSFTIGPALGDFVTQSHGNFTPFSFECDNYHDLEMPETHIDVYELKEKEFEDETFADIFKSFGYSKLFDLRIRFGQLVELFRTHKDFVVQTEYEIIFLLKIHAPDGQNASRMCVSPAMCGFSESNGKPQGPFGFTSTNIDDLLRSWGANKEKQWRIIVPRL